MSEALDCRRAGRRGAVCARRAGRDPARQREFAQCHRAAVRGVHTSLCDGTIRTRAQHCHRVVDVETLELDDLETGVVERRWHTGSFGDHGDDGLVDQSSEGEHERGARRFVDPVGVVDQQQQRSLLAGGGERRKCRTTYGQLALHGSGADRIGEHLRMRAGHVDVHRPDRFHQCSEAGVDQLRIRLGPGQANHRAGGLGGYPIEQGGLADPGIAAQPDGDARTAIEVAEHSLQQVEFKTATYDRRRTLPVHHHLIMVCGRGGPSIAAGAITRMGDKARITPGHHAWTERCSPSIVLSMILSIYSTERT